LWRKTNEQDGHFSAINHRGIASDGYIQGPYAVEEKLVDDFKSFYVDRASAALEKIS
jgi:Rieske 2Fe-2S family protein